MAKIVAPAPGVKAYEVAKVKVDPRLHPRVLAFYPDATACVAYRVVWPYNYLLANGYPVSYVHCSQMDTIDYSAYDMLVFQRLWQNTPEGHKKWLRLRDEFGFCLVWENDDSHAVPAWNPGSTDIPPHEWPLVQATMRGVDAITTTNETLAAEFRAYNPNVYTIPNYCFHRPYAAIRPGDRKVKGLTIGLQGGFNHLEDWRIVLEPLKRILADYPEVKLVLVGYAPDFFQELPKDRVIWDYQYGAQPNEYPRLLANIDIGLAPLVDIPFNHAKTPIKAWEYSLAGAACVASPVLYSQAIRHGENGLLASTPEEWYACIALLIDEPKTRRRLAETMKAEVMHYHCLEPRNFMAWWYTYRQIWEAFSSRWKPPATAGLWFPPKTRAIN